MIIRNMYSSDYEKVYRLWISCVGMGLNTLDDSKEGIEKFLKRNPDTCFVAVENGSIVGVIMVGHDGRRGYIYHTAVSPNHRNLGIGTSLVSKALNALKKLDISKVALVVFANNEVGNEFWEKQGFIRRDDLAYRNKELVELVRMDI